VQFTGIQDLRRHLMNHGVAVPAAGS
jgi:hypothetical protein